MRILEVAAALFRRQGYRSTTVRDIAEGVGILSGSLFYHFRSKEEILLEIMRTAAAANCSDAERVVAATDSPLERLKGLIDAEIAFTMGEHGRDFQAVLFGEWREIPQSAQSEFIAYRRRYRGIWKQVLEACRERSLLRCEPKAAELVIHSSIIGMTGWLVPAGRYSLAELGRTLANLVLADQESTNRSICGASPGETR